MEGGGVLLLPRRSNIVYVLEDGAAPEKEMTLHMCCALLAASRGAAHMGQPRMG